MSEKEYMTLRQLKAMLPTTEKYKKVPTAKFIRSSGQPVEVYENPDSQDDYQIAVYPCGFAIGRSGRRTAGVRIDECQSYMYFVDNDKTAFKDGCDDLQHYFAEEYFLDKPWPLRLMLAVDDKLQENEDNREQGWISRHPEIPDDKSWMNGGHYSFEDALIHRMEMEEVLELMTEKQRRVFVLYGRGYTQQEIGKMLGISRDSTKDRLMGAMKKVKRYYSNNY